MADDQRTKAQAVSNEACVEVGVRIRAARAKIGMTRRQLASASGTSERYLALLESGQGNPSVAVLSSISEALDLVLAELLPCGGERTTVREQIAEIVRRLPDNRLTELRAWLDSAPGRLPEKARRLVLVGLRGAGKTSLGSALAAWLEVPFVEIAKEVERTCGASIGVLRELGGQGALRRYESEVWDEICARHEAAVIAAPGAIVANPALYERMLQTSHTIWLQANPEDHMNRVMAQGDLRPMASNSSAMTDLKAILEARSMDYGRADAHVDTSAQSFEETLELLKKQTIRFSR